MADRHLVQLKTERFRGSLDPLWVRIRHLLIGMDLDPLGMVLACFEEEDFKFRFGILINGDGRVFQFGFDFSGRISSEGEFSEWEDLTGTWKTGPFRNTVEDGLAVLRQENTAR